MSQSAARTPAKLQVSPAERVLRRQRNGNLSGCSCA
jgi:hypothetical protein